MTARAMLLAAALAGTLAPAGLAVGCGGGGGGGAKKGMPPAVARPQDFPKPAGRTLVQLQKRLKASGPVLAPSLSQLEVGTNRFGFGLFDRARAQIADAPAAVYVARAGGGPASGPYLARYESLKVKPQFQSRTVATDPDAAKSVYVSDVRFRRPGDYEVLGVVRLDDRLVAATPAGPALKVVRHSQVPDVGQKAPPTHTPTKASVGGDLNKIDTRQPHDDMHAVDLADVLGKRPVILLFATPALCQSRVCGPVVDLAEQVKHETHGAGAAWIHMEIYRDNEVSKGFRPQVIRWRLPTEPWLFAIDRRGRIAARLEGAYSARELEQAVKAATRR